MIIETLKQKWCRSCFFSFSSFLSLLVFILFFYWLVFLPPKDFKEDQVVRIPQGSSINQSAKILKDNKIIKNDDFLVILIKSPWFNNTVIAGDYSFDQPENMWSVSKRISSGNFGPSIKVTIPEGLSNVQIADILEKNLVNFNREEFLNLAQELEGYLFPETYFFSKITTTKDVIELMNRNYILKTKSIRKEIERFKYSEHEILTMASLVEIEAKTMEDRRKIAGILWKRLEINMPLQVDAVFPYIIGKNTFEVNLDDLQYDSPYNTYRYRGLPPGPIANPSLEAIKATINPIETPYLYYLADKQGVTHYTKTFEEHVANKNKYLR